MVFWLGAFGLTFPPPLSVLALFEDVALDVLLLNTRNATRPTAAKPAPVYISTRLSRSGGMSGKKLLLEEVTLGVASDGGITA